MAEVDLLAFILSMSFRKQVANSAVWVGLSTVVVKAFSFITITLVLARVLAPADFGLVAIAWLAINSLEFFREMGVASALVYRRHDPDGRAADTAFLALTLSSLGVYALIFAAAPAVEYFFRNATGVTPVLRVLALTSVINAISQVPYTLLAKELNFRSQALPDIIASVLNSIVAITLALNGWGVWSLIGGYLTDAVARSSLVWFFTAWRPRWRFDRKLWAEMIAYGRHIAGSRLLIFGITNVDDLMVGRFLGTTPLGFYTLAYRLSNLPATHVTSLINSIMFPAFSKIQEDRERVSRVYFDTTHAIGLVSIPLALGTLALGPFFVHEYYLGKWDGAILSMQWLVIYGLMRSIAANLGNIYRALGKPQWLTYLALWRFVTMLALLYPAILWRGIEGVSILSALVAIIDFGIAAWLGAKLLPAPTTTAPVLAMADPGTTATEGQRRGGRESIRSTGGEYVRRLAPAFVAAGISSGLAYLTLPLAPAPHRLFPLLVAGMVMVLSYSLLSWWLDAVFRSLVRSGLRRLARGRLAARLGSHQ